MRSKIKNKKAAIELSIGTIVIIVLAMSMLILGLVLVRNIFSGATGSVDDLNDKVQDEIIKLFSDDSDDVVISLGSDNTAKIKQDTPAFSLAIGARTLDGSNTDRDRLKYELSLDENGDCVEKIGLKKTEALFTTRLKVKNSFDKFKGPHASALIELKIPEGTPTCTQKIFVDVTDTKTEESVGGSFFRIEIIQKGFF